MRTLIILLFVAYNCVFSYAQKAENTKIFFDRIFSQKPFDTILKEKRIIIKNIDLEDIILDKYILMRVYDNIDFNHDGKNDLILYINRYVSEDDKFKAKEASKYNYRILLVLINNNNIEYIFAKKYSALLNQNTEGLFCNSLKIQVVSDSLFIREFGRQIDTDWATEMVFVYDKLYKNWLLKKLIIYKANITSKEEKLVKPIKVFNISENIEIDSVGYYKYFPFGFSDDIY